MKYYQKLGQFMNLLNAKATEFSSVCQVAQLLSEIVSTQKFWMCSISHGYCLPHFYWPFCAFPTPGISSSHTPLVLSLKWAREGTLLGNHRDLGPHSPSWSIPACFCSLLAECSQLCERIHPRLHPKNSRRPATFSTSSWQPGCLLCSSRALPFISHLWSW